MAVLSIQQIMAIIALVGAIPVVVLSSLWDDYDPFMVCLNKGVETIASDQLIGSWAQANNVYSAVQW